MAMVFVSSITTCSISRNSNRMAVCCHQRCNIVGLLGPVVALTGHCNYENESNRDQLCYIRWICISTCRCPQKLLDRLPNHTTSNVSKANHLSFISAIEGYETHLVPVVSLHSVCRCILLWDWEASKQWKKHLLELERCVWAWNASISSTIWHTGLAAFVARWKQPWCVGNKASNSDSAAVSIFL